jgi:hypothetical protein
MATQQNRLLNTFWSAVMALLRLLWTIVLAVWKPIQPVSDRLGQLYAAVFSPIWTALGRTKLLDSVMGTIAVGAVILGLTLLAIRIFVNV